jgi:cell shape-determining protein MreC
MDYKNILEKYNDLLEEVNRLTKENSLLKAQLVTAQ